MCTVTFWPRKGGYALAMNRDEQLTRVTAVPPKKKVLNGIAILSPSEPSGGTWIALNERGVCLALINWYSITARAKQNPVSRGNVINSIIAAADMESAEIALARLPLKQINPFRLIGVFPASNEIVEWRWDLKRLGCKVHQWRAQQWISSGFDEPMAQRIRSKTFREKSRLATAGSIDWLRRLHRSHEPERGPFSTCMHRVDAATVSYTEVVVSPRESRMSYYGCAPCECSSRRLLKMETRIAAVRSDS